MSGPVPRARRCLASVLVAAVTGGCTTGTYVRETTTIVAGHVDSLHRDYSRYLQRLEADAATRIDSLADQRQSLARAELSLQRQLEKTSHGNVLDTLMTRGAERLEADRAVARRAVEERAALAAGQSKLDRDPLKQLKELSKQLTELATPANFRKQAGFLIEYFQAVGKEVNDLDAKAREKQKEAEAAKPKSTD